jgi:hypothetical protein
MKQSNPFDQAVEQLWKELMETGNQHVDSTTDFLQTKGMSMPLNPQQRRHQRRVGVVELVTTHTRGDEIKRQPIQSRHVLERRWGWDGLSLDRVPHCDVNNHLFTISCGLQQYTGVETVVGTATQLNLNRGWKCLLLGLCQAESFARYEALTFLQRCLPAINPTLYDNKTKSELGKRILEMVKGDERWENRTRGLFVLGEWIKEMGNNVDMHPLLRDIVLVLVREFASMVLSRSQDPLRIHLLKTLQQVMAFSIQGIHVKSIMMYLLYVEWSRIFETPMQELKPPHVHVFVLLGILDVLVSLSFSQHGHYLGALFHPFVTLCQQVHYKPITKKTLEFICKFLPVGKEESLEKGMEIVMQGIKELRRVGGILGPTGILDEAFWTKEIKEWQERHHKEQIRISLHAALLRRLLQPPGSVIKCVPISGCHGFFGEMETGMKRTESVLVELPIHSHSFVSMTRVVGQVPGVPTWATTTPPLCIQTTHRSAPPRSKYEYKERIGCLPGLPSGYTYAPSAPMKQDLVTPPTDSWDHGYRVEKGDWVEEDDVPSYATRFPPPVKHNEEGACPYGFTLVCPYPGFDPDKVEKMGTSPLYGRMVRTGPAPTPGIGLKDRYLYQEYHTLCSVDDPKRSHVVPDGTTVNRHPVLFPCKVPGLKPMEGDEFVPKAPILFDIIQPHLPKLRRILCIIEKMDGESSNIVVQKGNGDVGGLYEGATFTMYIKQRSTGMWSAVQLRVLDEHFEDGLDLSSTSTTQTDVTRRMSVVPSDLLYSTPVPVNYTQQGEPFFAPPVIVPPHPAGYNDCHVPYYGKTPSTKSTPLGVSVQGTRYYASPDKKLTPPQVQKHHLAGFDIDGHPFYVPRGMTVPTPCGFTVDGVPFYDIPSLIRTQGVFALPPLLRGDDRPPSEHEDWTDLCRLLHNPYPGSLLEWRRLESYFLQHLLQDVERSQPLLKKKLLQSRTRPMNPTLRATSGFTPPDHIVQEPIEISEFLRNSLAFAHLRPHPIRIVLEPAQCDFHSARVPITRQIALRFKAGRGDHTEREYFLAVEPAHVFSIREFNLKLQGEGFHEIAVTYYPLAMKGTVMEGAVHVFDKYGRKMAHSKLVAIKKHFFKIHTEKVELGWIPIHKKKESHVLVENLTELHISVGVRVNKDVPFLVPHASLKLRPLEMVKMPVTFAPKFSGTFVEPVTFIGPGGEESTVHLHGTTETPVSVMSEDELNSRLGITFLSMERSNMVKKWCNRKQDMRIVTGTEMRLIDKIQKSVWDPDIKAELLTIDFGICSLQDPPVTRCLTIFNWGKDAITISLFPHDPTISCPYLIRVASMSASTVEVTFDFNSPKQPNRGNYTSVIELSCFGYDNIFINVKAYIGQPVFFPLYEYAFFKPCRLGQISQISTTLVNESQYDVACYLEGLDERVRVAQRISVDHPITIPPFSLYPLTFVYRPDYTGPVMNSIRIHMVRPVHRVMNACLRDKELQLIGICIQPRKPDGDYLIHPAAEKILQWLAQCRNFKIQLSMEDFADDLVDIVHVPPEENADVMFKTDPFIIESSGDFGPPSNLIVQNRSASVRKIRFFASPGFTLEPRQRDFDPGETLRVEHFFQPPPHVGTLVTLYGFACSLDMMDSKVHATQIVKRMSLGFLLLPAQNYVEQNIVFEFGRMELTNDGVMESIRYLMLCNPFQFRYNWSIKLAPSARKNMGFEMPIVKGELQKFETFTVPFKFKIDVSGSFETKCDIFIDPSDQINKSVRLGTVTLRGTAIYTKLLGLPEAIEFGSTIVYHASKKRLNLQNEGSSELEIIVLVRSPFSIQPSKFSIPAKSNQWVDLSFSPTEHRMVTSLMQVFANQKLYGVTVSGVGGTAQLVCEQFAEKPLDFGLQRDGTIVWTDIYLTNKGTIPLKAIAVMSDQPKRVRVEYNGVLANCPGEDQMKFHVRKDYWNIVRRKRKVFPFLLQYSRYINIKRATPKVVKTVTSTGRKIIDVEDLLECDPLSLELGFQELQPWMSYHFRIGFPVSAREELDREITFSYLPLCDGSDASQLSNLVESISVELTGSIYVPLELKSTQLHFGYTPAEVFKDQSAARNSVKRFGAGASGVENHSVRNVKIFNKADVSQTVQLDRISPEFSIMGRIWTIKPGELLEIPVEFHPPREQTQYLGEAVFSHRYGVLNVKMDGTGASADLVYDDVIDFGNLKLETVGTQKMTLHNKGILPCSIEMDIVQTDNDFWFTEGDPYEFEDEVKNGTTLVKEISCQSRRKGGTSGHISIKWRRIPGGKVEKATIPLKLLIGYPEFRIENPELDFKATFIGINKTLPIKITNNGNASCNWHIQQESTTISVNITAGILEPGDSAILLVTYTPKEFEVLDLSVTFITDAGIERLICFGEVGVPYLKIDDKFRNYDFGVITVGRSHHMYIPVTNTGKSPQDFETKWLSMSRDSVPCAMEDLEFYFVEPTRGVIPPGETVQIKVTVFAKDYAVAYEASFCIFTFVGEQHPIHLKAVGGQAIINIQAPRMFSNNNNRNIATPNYEKRKVARKVGAGAIPVKEMEATKVLMKSHIDNLYSVVAGLRTAEEELRHSDDPAVVLLQKQKDMEKEVTKKGIKTKSSDAKAKSPQDAFLESIMKIENELEEAISKLDPSGTYSASKLSSQAGSRAQTAPDSKSTTPSSSSSSRSFGQYRPGRRILRRTPNRSQVIGTAPSSGPYSAEPSSTGVGSSQSEDTGSHVASQGQIETFDGPTALGPDPGSRPLSMGQLKPITPKPETPSQTVDPADLTKTARVHGKVKLEKLDLPKQGLAQNDVQDEDELTRLEGPKTGEVGPSKEADIVETEDPFDGTFVPQINKEKKKGQKAKAKAQTAQEKVQEAIQIATEAAEKDNDEEFTPKVDKKNKKFDPKLLDPELIADAKETTNEIERVPGSNSANMAANEVHQSQKEFLNLLSLAQNLGISIDVARENIDSIMQVNHMINSCMENTKSAIKTAKGTLIEESWIPNREVIQQALKKLQISTKAIDSILQGKLQEMHPEEEIIESTVYSLDLICGGDRSPSALLFCIPNEGNIPFSYSIEPIRQDRHIPPESEHMNIEFFSIENSVGILKPGDSVDISASFIGFASGTYRQGFALKSGEDEIMTFTVMGVVGNPILSYSVDELDFGLIAKGQTVSKQIVVKNTGTYRGNWDVSSVAPEELENGFIVNPTSGRTELQCESTLVITFHPTKEGAYQSKLEMVWKDGTLSIPMKGMGGGSKLEFHFESPEERQSNGIDFGNTLVGLKYERYMSIKNIGTLGTVVEISHPNRALIFNVPRNEAGEIRLEPGQITRIQIIYAPEKLERLKDLIAFTLGKPKTGLQSITVRGKSQTQSWEIEGALDFSNLKLGETQEKSVMVKNTGTANIPLEVRLEPESIQSVLDLSFDGWTPGTPIPPESAISVRLFAHSDMEQLVEGQIVFKSKILNETQERSVPIYFRFFVQEVITKIVEDVDLGRAVPGEQLRATQIISNYGNQKVNYRARLEMPSSGPTDWKIEGGAGFGTLDPNQSVEINAIFDAITGRGDNWQEARLIIEKTTYSEDDWTELSTIGLKAALGIAKFFLEPNVIDFGDVGVGVTKRSQIWIRNPGTAICLYQIVSDWAHSEEFLLPDNDMIGTVQPDSQIPLTVQFSPKEAKNYTSDITFKTSVGDVTLTIYAKTEELRINPSTIPKFVDFGTLFVNQIKTFEIEVQNDCTLDVDLDVQIVRESLERPNIVIVKPTNQIMVPRNKENEPVGKAFITLECGFIPQLDGQGCIMKSSLDSIPLSTLQSEVLEITNVSGIRFKVPINYKLITKDCSLHRTLDTPPITSIDFGDCNLESGALRKLMAMNPNPFSVRMKLSCGKVISSNLGVLCVP